MQIDRQILAAEIREAIAEQELDNHDLQIEKRRKWRIPARQVHQPGAVQLDGRPDLAASTSRAYQLAYDMAKRAERATGHELGSSDSSFIQFGYWDSLKKGLLAGERLLPRHQAHGGRVPGRRTGANTSSPSTSRWLCWIRWLWSS